VNSSVNGASASSSTSFATSSSSSMNGSTSGMFQSSDLGSLRGVAVSGVATVRGEHPRDWSIRSISIAQSLKHSSDRNASKSMNHKSLSSDNNDNGHSSSNKVGLGLGLGLGLGDREGSSSRVESDGALPNNGYTVNLALTNIDSEDKNEFENCALIIDQNNGINGIVSSNQESDGSDGRKGQDSHKNIFEPVNATKNVLQDNSINGLPKNNLDYILNSSQNDFENLEINLESEPKITQSQETQIRKFLDNELCIDSSFFGNIARFIKVKPIAKNESFKSNSNANSDLHLNPNLNPNLKKSGSVPRINDISNSNLPLSKEVCSQPMLTQRLIYANANDRRYPKLALFATTKILANTELLL
jgi:hypothetical protein